MQKIVSRQRQQGEEEEEEQQLSHPKRAREKGDPEERWNAQQRCSFNFFFLSWIVDGDTIKSNNNNNNNRSAFLMSTHRPWLCSLAFLLLFLHHNKGVICDLHFSFFFAASFQRRNWKRSNQPSSQAKACAATTAVTIHTHTHYTYSWPSAHFVYTRRCVCLGRPLKT